MKKFIKATDKLEEYFCCALLMVMLVILTYQVLLRFLFNSSNAWSEEVARYMFIWLVYVGSSYGFLKNAHIKIDVLMYVFPKGIRKYVKKIGLIVLICFTAFVSVIGWKYTVSFYRIGQLSMGLKIKKAYVYAAIPVGFGLMTIRNICNLFSAEGTGEEEPCQMDY